MAESMRSSALTPSSSTGMGPISDRGKNSQRFRYFSRCDLPAECGHTLQRLLELGDLPLVRGMLDRKPDGGFNVWYL